MAFSTLARVAGGRVVVLGGAVVLAACSGTSTPADEMDPTAGAPSATGGGSGPAGGSGGTPATSTAGTAGPVADADTCTVLTPEPGSYRARLERTLLPPAGNVMGIARDGESLWLSMGTHNVPSVTLTRYSIETRTILKSLPTPDLFSALGTGPYGIEVNGDEILISVSGNENQIVRLDRESGEILGTLGSPSELGPSDLAWLNGELLVSTGTGKMYAANLAPPASSRPFTASMPDSGRDAGVATCNDVVVWGGLFSGMTVQSASGEVLGDITRADRAFEQTDLGPLTFYGNQLVIASTAGLDFYSLEPIP